MPQGCVPHPWIPAAGGMEGLGRAAPAPRKHYLCSVLLLPPGTTTRKRMVKDLNYSGLGKGGKFSPQVLPNFHARTCPAMGISRMCQHPQAEQGHTRTPCAAARWGELGAERIPGSSFSMVYSYSRYFGALAVITVQHLRQNKSKNLPTTLKSDFE